METETEAQRGWGLVLSHTQRDEYKVPSLTWQATVRSYSQENSQIASVEALCNWKFCTNTACCFNLAQPPHLAHCLVSICCLILLFRFRASLPLLWVGSPLNRGR